MHRGALPLRCSCSHEHSPLIGLSEDDTFRTSAAIGFGPDFWNSCFYDATLERSFVSLRAGDQADLTPLGASPLLSPSLASCPSSLRSVYEAWKAGTLTRSMLADVTSSDYMSAFFEGSSDLSSTRSSLRSLWRVSSVVATSGSSSIISFASALAFTFTFEKTPGPFAAEGAWLIRGDWRFTWVAERQVRGFHITVSLLCKNNFPFCPWKNYRAGSVGPRGTRVRLRLDTGAGQRVVTGTGLDTLRNGNDSSVAFDGHDTSALGEGFEDAPIGVLVRGHLDSIKSLLK